MFFTFLRFELKTWLTSWMLWIFTLIIATIIFAASSSDKITVGAALGNTYRNAPYVIQTYYSIMCILTLLMTVAFVNSAASRDFAYNTHQILFSTPLRKFDYLLGRYIGASLISVIPMVGISVGIILAKYMPWVDAERWGAINWQAHLQSILVFAIPNTFFIAAIIFAIAVLTRSTVTSFIGGLLVIVFYTVSTSLTQDLKNETAAILLDPFGITAFSVITKYWTVVEKNSLSVGFTGMLLWNRLLWMSVSAVIFVFAYRRFRFAERTERKKKNKAKLEAPQVNRVMPAVEFGYGVSAQIQQFLATLRVEFWGLVKSTSFIVIAAAALLNMIPSLILAASEGYGNSSLPVTYWILDLIQGTLYLFLIGIITYYAGVMVWKERDAHMDEIQDALPHPNWTGYLAKFIALLGAIFIIQILAMLTGISVQAFQGYHRFQFDLYLSELFFFDFTSFIMLGSLAFFFHVIMPNKYVGYFGFVTFLVLNAFVWRPLGIGTRLVKFGSTPPVVYSDMYGRAPFLEGWLWFSLYWLLFCGLLAVTSILLWQRGRQTDWHSRLQNAAARFHGGIRLLTLGLLVCFVATGGWIFYNTKILNTITTEKEAEQLRAAYEKTYKQYETLPQPRVTGDIHYKIEVYPESRNLVMASEETIENRTGKPIPEVHFTVDRDFKTDINLEGASLRNDDQRLSYRIYKFASPMQPGEKRRLQFTVKSNTRGFENAVSNQSLVQNGTFFNNGIAPQIGYQAGGELTDRNDRKKQGLKEKDLMPALEKNCTSDCVNTYLSNNSDWINVDTVIGTSPDQIAVAPGSLLREWTENGRHYYNYKLDHYSMNFYSFISARYEVAREEWNGVKLEVYYDKNHAWNVPKMMRSVRKSLEYDTANFGPYAHKEARIIEFPRVARFAQAFPGTMPYSEAIGFIANLKDPEDIDMVYYIVAHEMGHQWWAHQVIGANMQGATLLSETLAQYSALMLMEKEYGRDTMRKFLKYEMDNYLRSRGRELLKERPLLRVDASQGYVHYRKGSVAMYYLKEMIGEEAMNRALHKVVQQYAYAQPPYPTSYVLEDALREQTPPEFQYLLTDLLDNITLFSNRTTTAKAKKRADGKYDVTIVVEAHKFKADEKGTETEIPINDTIEIGAFAKPAKGKKYGKTLHRERIRMTAARGTYTFVVDELPDKAGIDPFLLLIDRIPDDNMKSVDVS